MKQGSLIKKIISFFVFFSFFLSGSAARTEAATMSDYCVTPPFIVSGVKPNLLFMLDNSASMYDLIYADTGSATRDASYCFDNTFKATQSYSGYFDQSKEYSYDLVNNYFYEDSAGVPLSCDHLIPGQLCINKTVSGSTFTLTKFTASGQYLNWLTASKFDVQKEILTGGKYDTAQAMLLPETRGCIGRKFIKEALAADFVDYTPAGTDSDANGRDDNDTNTPLGITFAVKGPENANNPTAPSPGGQTYLSIYFGDFNQRICQAATGAYSDPSSSNASIKKAVDDCISYTTTVAHCALDLGRVCHTNSDCDNINGLCAVPVVLPVCSGTPKKCVGGSRNGQACKQNSQCQFSWCTSGRLGTICGYNNRTNSWDNSVCNTSVGPCQTTASSTSSKTGVTFGQTIQACWARDNGTPISTDEINTIKIQCSDIYDELYNCDGGFNSGKSCTVATELTDCGAGISCVRGPNAVKPGNPAYVCSTTYTGKCAVTPDGWAHTNWTGSYNDGTTTFTGDACVRELHIKFCNDITVPPVVDPTDDTSDTSQYDNLPAIINDIGLEAQLNQPFKVLTVRNKDLSASPVAPEGLLNDFSDTIRMGAMRFNVNGSASECGQKVCSDSFITTCSTNAECTGGGTCITPAPCPKLCSTDTNVTCSTPLDCPNPSIATCNATVAGTDNLDGAMVLTYISDSVGDHTTGLVKTVDDLRASSWTPFAEGFYNAIGYFARTDAYGDPNVPGTSRDDLIINAGDYALNKNPSQFRCQDNNILIISDGQSTADKNTDVTDLVAVYSGANGDGDNQTDSTGFAATCPKYQGTMNLDDLAWLAKKRNIKTFSKSTTSTTLPATASELITTYVVYTGPNSNMDPPPEKAECDPRVLMNETAINGGTALYNPENPENLETSLRDALNKIAAKTASGTAASVLASGEGSGANLIQALFYPQRRIDATDIRWNGVLQNLWYYIDPHLGSSSIREDTNLDKTLNLDSDYILQYTFAEDETKVNLYADANGNGIIDNTNVPPTPTVSDVTFSDIKSLWEAGKLLFSRTPGSLNTDAGARKIFTNLDDTSALDEFDTNAANVPLLQPILNVSDTTEAEKLIKYIRGIDDIDGDSVAGDSNNDGANDDTGDTIDGLVVRNRTVTIGTETNTWKLGDIVNATPKIVSWVPLNLYDKVYLDSTYKQFTHTSDYLGRDRVYSGANDGMLHAFKLGLLGIYNDANKKATIGRICSSNPSLACSVDADCPSGTCDTDADLGKEVWSFIPKNALPYLKYFADSNYCHLYYIDATPNIVDVSIYIDTDKDDDGTNDQTLAACNSDIYGNYWECDKTKESWRTILIGGMRLGGACRNSSSNCKDCTKTPIADTGYSTYFALDITDPDNPTLLWELSNEALGYSTSGPAIVRIGDRNKNGRWYAVFGSGPSGYVSPGSQQFLGITEHNNYTFPSSIPPGGRGDLRLFVYDLKSGSLLRTINIEETYSDLYAAFAGSMVNGAIDFDQNKSSSTGFYQDDAVYFGYTGRAALGSTFTARAGTANTIRLADGSQDAEGFYNGKFIHRYDGSHETKLITAYSGLTGDTTYNATVDSAWKDAAPTATTQYNIFSGWTDGGVLRLLTKQDLDPAQWDVSRVISGIGPVTAAVAKLQNYKSKNLRLFFGTGRYFYKVGSLIDDATSQRRLYGVTEPCFSAELAGIDTACTTTVLESSLGNASTSAGSTDADGWYINLDLCVNASGIIVACSDTSSVFRTERLVTDPLAVTTGAVFFTTSSPAADICEYGGQSHLWAVNYETGGSLVGTGVLRGKAIVQVSTGSIEEVDLNTAFTEREGRRSEPMQGLPPSGYPLIVVPPKPLNKILHMKKQ